MEKTETLDTSWISSTTKGSSWSIVRGSLQDSVNFESSISAVDSDSDHTVDQRPKSPLILRRSSPDCGPCEITICLAHQHEIRQVYVRSTARVYEIYCATDEKGGNDYLCTVRCSLTAQNEGPVQVTDAVGSVPATYSGSNRCGEEGNSGTESGSSTNEDGWVDVDPSGFDGGNHSFSNKTEGCSEKGNQDLFEATAEISDADPVKSVTLRFLSIKSGDYIYIDEVYIYADPFISEDTDSSPNMPENSSGSALMSMLVPTLLQLSKSRMSQTQQRNDSIATERRVNLNAEHESASAAITSSTFQSEIMPSSDIYGASVHMSQREVPVQTRDPQSRPYSTAGENRFPGSHLERTLGELVSRISRIESFCSRFEENMLKPISSMEARLEKVEQQLESLCKNSTWVNENDCHGHTKSNLVKNDDCCHEEMLVRPPETSSSVNAVQPFVKDGHFCQAEHSVLPCELSLPDNTVQPSEVPSSASASPLHPGLVVTAPDFSCIDDEEENDVIEEVKILPIESPKKAMSIDDALASALAGFLSSTSTDPSKCIDMVEETLDLPSEERSGENSPLAVVQYVEPGVSSIHVDGSNPPVNISHKEYELTEVRESLSSEQDSFKSADGSVDSLLNLEKGKMEDSGCIEADNVTSEALVSDFPDTPPVLNSTFSNDDSIAPLELSRGNIDSSTSEEIIEVDSDVLQNILKLPLPATVDFEIPILDVKFSSLANPSGKSPLEVLVDMPESRNEVLCVREDNESSLSDPTDLVVIEDGDSATSGTPGNQFFLNNYDSCCLPSEKEEEQQDPRSCSDQDMCASLI